MTEGRLTVGLIGLVLIACGGGEPAPVDAGRADAGGVDARVLDAGRECARVADCADGLFCNGAERCVDALCVAGAPPCEGATERCSEELDRCEALECEGALGDRDGDGYRSPSCGGADCDDDDASINPGAMERCVPDDPTDEDCEPRTFGFVDVDEDGAADARCSNVDERTGTRYGGTDCDDARPGVNPSVPEVCGNGLDDDCDGSMDEGLLIAGFSDRDGDGWGEDAAPIAGACPGTPGFAALGGDCDEDDATINPGSSETCDGVDNDCDGAIDDGLPTMRCYRDEDGDGYGVTAASEMRCTCGSGWATLPGDCFDVATSSGSTDPAMVHPGAEWQTGGWCDVPPGTWCSVGYGANSGDWNCDGIEEPRYPGGVAGCLPAPFCEDGGGWVDRAPDCDEAGTWFQCNRDCTTTTTLRAQECR